MEPALEAKGICKQFSGVLANDHIDFSVGRGEIHALLGENGAGKSTLMRIIYGLYTRDAGEILLQGKPVTISSPLDAIRQAIGMVHQEFQLVSSLTGAENIALGQELCRGPFIDRKRIQQTCEDILQSLHIDIDILQPVSKLSIGAQQLIEITKLLYRKADILILDEPTTVLTPQEVEGLFRILFHLRDEGKTIILITHKLGEIRQCAERATILRKGRVQGTVYVSETPEEELVRLMMGETVKSVRTEGSSRTGKPQLVLESLSVQDPHGVRHLNNVSFSVEGGEIVGIAGVEGNGQRELVETITGIRPSTGKIFLQNKDITSYSLRHRRLAGMAVIPENRVQQGLNIQGTLAENLISLSYFMTPFSKHGFIKKTQVQDFARKSIKKYQVAAQGADTLAATLSGGNAQKVVVARELASNPQLLLASHPTRGLDIRATQFVRSQILALREAGVGILLISADLDELFALADRILVMFRGSIVGECTPLNTDYNTIGLLMSGAKEKGISDDTPE